MPRSNSNSGKSLRILHLNIRSCSSNFSHFLSYLKSLDVTYQIIILSESWLCSGSENLFNIAGYYHSSIFRTQRNGGGISIYVCNDLSVNRIEDLSIICDTHEALFFKVYLPNVFSVVIGGFYRPPQCSIINFNDYINSTLFTDQSILR